MGHLGWGWFAGRGIFCRRPGDGRRGIGGKREVRDSWAQGWRLPGRSDVGKPVGQGLSETGRTLVAVAGAAVPCAAVPCAGLAAHAAGDGRGFCGSGLDQ